MKFILKCFRKTLNSGDERICWWTWLEENFWAWDLFAIWEDFTDEIETALWSIEAEADFDKSCNPIRISLMKNLYLSTPQFHTDPLSSTHQFNKRTTSFHLKVSSIQNPSVQHRKPTVKHLIPLNSTHSSVQHQKRLSSILKSALFNTKNGVLNWGVFGVELRDFWYWTEECVELMGFRCLTEKFWGWKGVALLCWTEGGVELRRTLNIL